MKEFIFVYVLGFVFICVLVCIQKVHWLYIAFEVEESKMFKGPQFIIYHGIVTNEFDCCQFSDFHQGVG